MPPQLFQKIAERITPITPTSIRITPTVWRSMPLVRMLTAKARIAPTAMRKMLVPMPTLSASSRALRPAQADVPSDAVTKRVTSAAHRQGNGEIAPAVGPPLGETESGGGQFRLHTGALELGPDAGAQRPTPTQRRAPP